LTRVRVDGSELGHEQEQTLGYQQPDRVGLMRVPRNANGRDYFVGDVQGELELLKRLLVAVNFDPDRDRLFSVGDLVDRGSDSWGVLQFAMSSPWLYSVLGNHEVMAAECFLGRRDADPLSDQAWTASVPRCEIQSAITFLLSRPPAIEVESASQRVGLIHGELPLGSSWSDLAECRFDWADADPKSTDRVVGSLLWGRQRLHQLTSALRQGVPIGDAAPDPAVGIDLIAAGHTVLRLNGFRPTLISGHLWLDTGAGNTDGRLTMVDLEAKTYLQVGRNSKVVCGRLLF
jgi:serine/threonine protein phosphatase 1